MPATKDYKSTVSVVVAHGGVLTGRRSLVVLRHDLLPSHGLKVQEAGRFDTLAEGTGLGLTKVAALTSEDEVLVGGDSLDHHGGVIPTGNAVVDICVLPLTCLQIEDNEIGEL